MVLECQEMLYFNPKVPKCLNHSYAKLLFPPFTYSTSLCHFCRKQIQGDQDLLQHGNPMSLF